MIPLRFALLTTIVLTFFVCITLNGQEVSRPSDLLKGIADDVIKDLRAAKAGDPSVKAALEKANQQIEAFCAGKTGTFSFAVKEVDSQSSEKKNILVHAPDENDRFLGKAMRVEWGFLLDDSQRKEAEAIKKGKRVTATGTPWGILDWQDKTGEFVLSFWLNDAKLK